MSTVAPTIESAYKPSAETAKALGYSLALAFLPHSKNSATRKYVTLTVTLTWAVVTVMRHMDFVATHTNATQVYWGLTMLVFAILAHMWGFEYGALSAARRPDADGNADDDGGDDTTD